VLFLDWKIHAEMSRKFQADLTKTTRKTIFRPLIS